MMSSLKKSSMKEIEADISMRCANDNNNFWSDLLPLCCDTKPVVNDLIKPKLNSM